MFVKEMCQSLNFIFFTTLLLYASSCTDSVNGLEEVVDVETPDWTTKTHGKGAEPDYATVFNQNEVNILEISMTEADWEFIQADMEEKFGNSFGGGQTGGGGNIGGGGGVPTFATDETDYVAVSVRNNDTEWYKVGFRLKGNSTLSSTWGAGIYKLPFRLNFDKFEDAYPAINNQRFYGFKELSLSPGVKDNSLIREKVTADIFREAGIPAAQTAFYRVYIDFGDGMNYCGIYTMVEVIDDTMIASQFGEDDGNIYKPESTLAEFTEDEFEKKNNEDEGNYTDVRSLIETLHSNLRTSNPEEWRAELESHFHADHFLKWLAINTAIVNWDSYGTMAHNYYLYNQPGKGLTWIPWDHNEALADRSGPNGSSQITLSLLGVSSSWPLIRYLMDDDVYYSAYVAHLTKFSEEVFVQDKMNDLFQKNHDLISPYVIGPVETESGDYTHLSTPTSFNSALSELKNHVSTRRTAVNTFLGN